MPYQLALANGFSVWGTQAKCLKMQEQGEGYQEMVKLCTGNCSDPPAGEVVLDKEVMLSCEQHFQRGLTSRCWCGHTGDENAARLCHYSTWPPKLP